MQYSINCVPNWKWSTRKVKLKIVIMKDFSYLWPFIRIFLYKTIDCRSLKIIAKNMNLILSFYSIVEVFSDVYVFLVLDFLTSLVSCNCNSKCS